MIVIPGDARKPSQGFYTGGDADVVQCGEPEGVDVARLCRVVGLVPGTVRREGLPRVLILPHLQRAGARVHAGGRVGAAPCGAERAGLHR